MSSLSYLPFPVPPTIRTAGRCSKHSVRFAAQPAWLEKRKWANTETKYWGRGEGAGETAQWLRALATLAKIPESVHGTHGAAHTNSSFSTSSALF